MKVYLLLARHGPNDKGEVVDVYATSLLAQQARIDMEDKCRTYVESLNMGGCVEEPPYFGCTLVVEEREVRE